MEKVVIIGSGPAGLTAAIYSARAMQAPVLIAGTTPGGQLTQTSDIENYPGFENPMNGFDLMTTFRKQAERFGTKVVDDAVKSLELKNGGPHQVILAGGETLECTALIVATGASPGWREGTDGL